MGQGGLGHAEAVGGVRDAAVVGDRAQHRQVAHVEAGGRHGHARNSWIRGGIYHWTHSGGQGEHPPSIASRTAPRPRPRRCWPPAPSRCARSASAWCRCSGGCCSTRGCRPRRSRSTASASACRSRSRSGRGGARPGGRSPGSPPAGVASGIGWTTYMTAIDHVSVASAGVVYMSYPLFVVVLGWLLLGQRLTGRALLGAALVVAGAVTVNPPAAVPAGDLLVLAASVAAPMGFALMVVLIVTTGHGLNARERWSAVCVGHVAGLLPAALLADPGAIIPATRAGWMWLAGLGAVTATIPQLIYTRFAPRISPARAATTGAIELPTMLAVGWLAFGEHIGLAEVAGAIMVATAIAVTPSVAPQRHGGLLARAGGGPP
ncbi:MAG: DMT family transporter [Halofilum sp. (in: g-proteobacteria)]|nr:DMT family transporter [Halofilum sp. (in: g-proteobacteria)]